LAADKRELRGETLIVFSANETNQTEKWRFLFFCLTFFCLMSETAINARGEVRSGVSHSGALW